MTTKIKNGVMAESPWKALIASSDPIFCSARAPRALGRTYWGCGSRHRMTATNERNFAGEILQPSKFRTRSE
jgi:hypothetical protein